MAEQARTVDPARLLLTLLAGLFYVVGWSVGKLIAGTWFALSCAATAVKLGFTDAMASRRGQPDG